MTLIRILIVDDHELFRKGLRAFLETNSTLEICGEVRDGLEAVAKARELRPDVILMDISLPTLSGFEATRRICAENPDSKIIVLSQHALSPIVHEAFKSGAKAYIIKSKIADRLWGTLQTVIEGGLFNWNYEEAIPEQRDDLDPE